MKTAIRTQKPDSLNLSHITGYRIICLLNTLPMTCYPNGTLKYTLMSPNSHMGIQSIRKSVSSPFARKQLLSNSIISNLHNAVAGRIKQLAERYATPLPQ